MAIPEELKKLPLWTIHDNKRPIIPPGHHANASTFYQLVKEGTPSPTHPDQLPKIGMLLASAKIHPHMLIDIDFPGTKEEKQELSSSLYTQWSKNPRFIGSTAHLSQIERMLSSIANTELPALLTQTYTEFSPSLTGLRMVIKSEDKAKFRNAYKKAKAFTGQIDFYNQFMTFTSLQFPNSPSIVLEVPLLFFTKAFGFQAVTSLEVTAKGQSSKSNLDEGPRGDKPKHNKMFPTLEMEQSKLPPEKDIIKALQALPIDQSSRIRILWEEITEAQYAHYDYWLSVGMALHHYSTMVKGSGPRLYLEYLRWSAQDPVSFTGDDDVETKWRSFSNDITQASTSHPPKVTWKTLLKLANRLVFSWPMPQRDGKGRLTGCPLINEWSNFEYLLNFYSLCLHEDEGYYVSGEPEIVNKYFALHGTRDWFFKYRGPLSESQLCSAMTALCQDSHWRGLNNPSNHVRHWIETIHEEMDLFKLWLDTPFESLPEDMQQTPVKHDPTNPHSRKTVLASRFNHNSNLDYIFKCLNTAHKDQTERAMYYSMVKATFMQMIKFREQLSRPFDDNGGMLILVGEENTRKTTFFKILLPPSLYRLRKEVSFQVEGQKALRDFQRHMGKRTIVQLDEFEALMDQENKRGALFKNIISSNTMDMVDIYSTTETRLPRRAIVVATTNERKHILSDNGSRRMWFVKVNKIDTDAMLCINWHKFYNDMRDEFRVRVANNETPWLLTQEEIGVLYGMNETLSAKSDIAVWLDIVWPTTDPMPEDYITTIKSVQTDKTNKLYSTPEILAELKIAGMTTIVKMPALERALERHCGRYTGTFQRSIPLTKPKGVLTSGLLQQGLNQSGQAKYRKWVMPPKATYMAGQAISEYEDRLIERGLPSEDTEDQGDN